MVRKNGLDKMVRKIGPENGPENGPGPDAEAESMILGTTTFLWTLSGQEFMILGTTTFLGTSSGQDS